RPGDVHAGPDGACVRQARVLAQDERRREGEHAAVRLVRPLDHGGSKERQELVARAGDEIDQADPAPDAEEHSDDELGQQDPEELLRRRDSLSDRLPAESRPLRDDEHDDLMGLADALVELQELTERLRRDCPWDREQTVRTIVPHTVEEAYEVADAALAGDDRKLREELGDLLFQSYFLALLLSEQGEGDLEAVARGIHAKLVARHPHVFGDVEAETAGRVRENWERLKVEQEAREGIFHHVPETLPA